ncbi:MAG: metallophosphoesterase [Erysipelotrichales bacterium]
MSNKKIIKIIIALIISILLFVLFLFKPSFYKNNIKVVTSEFNYSKKEINETKVISFSDVNLLHDYQIKDLDNLVFTINSQNPDIVVFNGDLIAKGKALDKKQAKTVVSKLQQIKPLFGKFYISGENDDKAASKILFDSDFENMNNTQREVVSNNVKFNIIGLNSIESANKVMKNVSDNNFNLLFIHNPEGIEQLKNYKVDCLVAGHTLGGEYYIPLFGSAYDDLSKGEYNRGQHTLDNMDIIISNGIGTKHKNLRFNAPSSIEKIIIK